MKAAFGVGLVAAALWVLSIGQRVAADPAPAGVHVQAPAGVQVDVNRGNNPNTTGTTASGQMSGAGAIARASDLMGVGVYNSANERLGKIENLVIDTGNGRIRYAVLSHGGVLGMGSKLFAVPWRDLKLAPKGEASTGLQKEDHYVLDIPKEDLKNAPGFDKDHWPNFADQNMNTEIDRFYQQQAAQRQGTTERR
jgi:sporulation protein YlmC with PRC-barrel domain